MSSRLKKTTTNKHSLDSSQDFKYGKSSEDVIYKVSFVLILKNMFKYYSEDITSHIIYPDDGLMKNLKCLTFAYNLTMNKIIRGIPCFSYFYIFIYIYIYIYIYIGKAEITQAKTKAPSENQIRRF